MTTTISIRLDDDALQALALLESEGQSRSEAVRAALVETASRRRRRALAEEARRLVADPVDRAEAATVNELMESLRAPW